MDYNTQYKNIMQRIINEGVSTDDRTGVGTYEVFDVNLNAELSTDVVGESKLPLVTLRKVYPRSMWYELLWMLRGSTDVTELQSKNIKIWNAHSSREFLDSRGLYDTPTNDIGAAYGEQFRNFNGVDQLSKLLKGLITNPNSRRHMISLWNVGELDYMALEPCHVMYNFMVSGDTLNLKFFQRSSDFLLAGNANIIFASFFLHWVAQKLGFKVGSVAHSITNCHLYRNHIPVCTELLEREDLETKSTFTMPDTGTRFNTVEVVDNELDKELRFLWNNDKYWEVIKESLDYTSHPPIDPSRLGIAI